MAQVKKLSVGTVWGAIDVRKVLASDRPIAVMHVGGTAVDTKQVPTPYGESTCIMGEFTAVHPETGEMSEAGQLYLPEVAVIPLRLALAREGARAAEFAFTIFVKAAVDAKPGGSVYEYTFENRMPISDNDPRAKMRQLLLEAAGKAPALTDESKATPAPAPAPAKKTGRR